MSDTTPGQMPAALVRRTGVAVRTSVGTPRKAFQTTALTLWAGGAVAGVAGAGVHHFAHVPVGATVHEWGAAAMLLGMGGVGTSWQKPSPSPRNRIGIQSRMLRRVMTGGGSLVATAGIALEAAGVSGGLETAASILGSGVFTAGVYTGL